MAEYLCSIFRFLEENLLIITFFFSFFLWSFLKILLFVLDKRLGNQRHSILIFLKNIFCILVLSTIVVKIAFLEILPEKVSLYSYFKNIDKADEWISMLGLIVSFVSAVISTIIAIIANKISNAQKETDEFQFNGLFNIEIDDAKPIDIKEIKYSDNARIFLLYRNKLNHKKREGLGLENIYSLGFSLDKHLNSQVYYKLNVVYIFTSKFGTKEVFETIKEKEKCFKYTNVSSEVTCINNQMVFNVIIQDKIVSEKQKDHPLAIMAYIDKSLFQVNKDFTIFLEFSLQSNDNLKFINDKKVGFLLNIERDTNDRLFISNSLLISI